MPPHLRQRCPLEEAPMGQTARHCPVALSVLRSAGIEVINAERRPGGDISSAAAAVAGGAERARGRADAAGGRGADAETPAAVRPRPKPGP